MKQIVVPTDFSPCADTAIDFAVQSAKLIPAEITLLHSFEVSGNTYTDYMGVNKEFNRSMLSDAHEKLTVIQKRIENAEGPVVHTVVSTDTLKDAIKHTAKEKNADLVVMGTLGASGIKEKLWGSRTAALIGNTDVPVMIIPHAYQWQKPEKLLLVTNHFEKEPAILNCLFELAGLYMARIQVAVFTHEHADHAVTFLEHNRELPHYEEYLKRNYNEETLTSAHLYGTNFQETVQQFINENSIDILAMVAYPHHFGDSLFHPSHTKRMSYHTSIPLLVIPAVKNQDA
ncbi:MAG TPA: universal stress protein [Agriterribacter sp.]|nr:universal stress protein [Agriterribacter sp.]